MKVKLMFFSVLILSSCDDSKISSFNWEDKIHEFRVKAAEKGPIIEKCVERLEKKQAYSWDGTAHARGLKRSFEACLRIHKVGKK
jgi:hypothetical protein